MIELRGKLKVKFMIEGKLHEHKNCFIQLVEEIDGWTLEHLYLPNSMLTILDGIHFEDEEDAIKDGEQLINYLLSNLNKLEDIQEIILVPIDDYSNFVTFKNYLEQGKSEFKRHLSWKLRKIK